MIGTTTRQVNIRLPFVSCDLCNASELAVQIEKLASIVAAAPTHQVTHGTMFYPEFELLDLETPFRSQLNLKGWTHETYHGRDMILCPECSQK